MATMIEMGTVSSRGQIAIPARMREALGLEEGSKVLFKAENGFVIIAKVTEKSWEKLTEPLLKLPKKIREDDVNELIHRIRKEKNKNSSRH